MRQHGLTIAALVALAVVLGSATRFCLAAEPPEQTQRLKKVKPDPVENVGNKANKIDNADEELEPSTPEVCYPIGEGKIKIISKSFLPPGAATFTTFSDGTWVDVERDPESLTINKNVGNKNTNARIKVSATETQAGTAGQFPMKCEGNLSVSGTGGNPPHWSAKVDKELKAYAANTFWIEHWGHAAEIKGLIDNLGYTTLTDEPPTKASAVAAAPARVVWYSLSHGGTDPSGNFACSFGWWGLDPLYADDLPGELYYRLVFVNGCKSATGAGWAFANKFGAKAYVGWGEWSPSSPVAVIFANAFFSALKGHKTVQEAVNAGIEAFKNMPEYPFVASSITILRGANVIVDVSSD